MSSRILSASAALLIFTAFPLFSAERDITEITPLRGRTISTPLIMGLDILPGAGHFYLGNNMLGSAFAALKIGGFAAGYYYFQDWRDKKNHKDGSSKKAKDADLAAQNLTFAVIGNAVVYGISWFIVYQDCSEINRRSQPIFEISSAGASKPGVNLGFRYSF